MGFEPSHPCGKDERFSILGVSETQHFKTPGAKSAHVTNLATKFHTHLRFVQARPRAAYLNRPRVASEITVPVLAKVEAAKVEGASEVETVEGEPEVEGSLVVLFSRSFCASPSPEDEGFTEPEFIAVDRAGEGPSAMPYHSDHSIRLCRSAEPPC
jgi:hypothetical protein